MEISAKNVKRAICSHCGNYCNICLVDECPMGRTISNNKSQRCHACGIIITPDFQEVPWWHGREVPGHVRFGWDYQASKRGRYLTRIPELFLEVHIWLEGENGRHVTRGQAIEFFLIEAKKMFPAAEVEVIPNEEWERHGNIKCPAYA